MSNRRTGKIARLPHDLRTEINIRLRDGAPYPAIIKWLESQDVFGINEQNLTNWKEGGYQDWLRTQERIAEIAARKEAALDMVRELKNGSDVHITEANELILASQINEALSDFDPDLLKQLIADNPRRFFDLASAVTSQTNERTKRQKLELDFQKYRDSVEEKKKKILEATQAARSKGGLTQETLRTIEEQARLL